MAETSLEKKAETLPAILGRIDTRKRFQDMLGEKAPGFVSSIMSVYNSNEALQQCDPYSILAAAVIAATLDLPINQSLSRAFIIPYSGKAQFQIGVKGLVELALRTGQYKTIHTTDVYRDEIKRWNALTGEFEPTDRETHKLREKGDPKDVVGYLAFFKLVNGFEKFYYLTVSQVDAHARKYSKSYSNPSGLWKTNPHVMSLKTVLKLLLSKYGILSIQMQRAIEADQAVIDVEGQLSYPDRAEIEPVVEKPVGAEKKINDDQFKLLCARIDKSGVNPQEVMDYIRAEFKLEHRHDLTVEQLTTVLKWLDKAKETAK